MNYYGTWSLYKKEVRRFIKVYNQTLIAPMVTTLLFLAIFNLAVGGHVAQVGTVPFHEFMAAGLIMMAVVQNAFANTSSSLIMGKVMGTIVDILMPPLNALEVVLAMTGAAVTRGVVVGILVAAGIAIFVPLSVHHWGFVLFHLIAASMLLALLGLLGGILAETFDQMAAVTSYVITPLSFLSGTFYSVEHLPPFWYTVSHLNPFFYMIDGFRYGMTGYHDGSLAVGLWMMLGINLALWLVVHRLFAKGWRIKQ